MGRRRTSGIQTPRLRPLSTLCRRWERPLVGSPPERRFPGLTQKTAFDLLLTLAGSDARGYDRGRPMLRELQVKQPGDAT
jgi:hypothetical protein